MKSEQYDNSGVLFRNDNKTRDTDRDYSGSATIAGVEYWMSGWIKEGKRGRFMSFAFTPKHQEKSAAGVRNGADEWPAQTRHDRNVQFTHRPGRS
jgi:hypothetical protein